LVCGVPECGALGEPDGPKFGWEGLCGADGLWGADGAAGAFGRADDGETSGERWDGMPEPRSPRVPGVPVQPPPEPGRGAPPDDGVPEGEPPAGAPAGVFIGGCCGVFGALDGLVSRGGADGACWGGASGAVTPA
jgi:hypothetical protein